MSKLKKKENMTKTCMMNICKSINARVKIYKFKSMRILKLNRIIVLVKMLLLLHYHNILKQDNKQF